MEYQTITEKEIQQFRAETSGTRTKVHFNNAGASLPPDVVVETVTDYLREESLNGGYETESLYEEQIEETYRLIARLINARPEEIALTENATTAWGLAFHGIGLAEGDEVITSEMEYTSNLLGFLNLQQMKGVKTIVIPNDEKGNFDLRALEAAFNSNTRLIAVTHIASGNGGMMPINAIGSLARKHGVLYLVDACQSIGQYPLDVEAIQCDMLSVTGRKYLRAPRGTGFLYVRKSVQDQVHPVFMDHQSIVYLTPDHYTLRADARRYELYEKNRALTMGLGKAVEYVLNIGQERIWRRIQHLASQLRAELRKINGVTVHDIGDEQCGIVTFSVNGFESAAIMKKLAENNINVSVSGTRSTLLFMNKHHLHSVIRASVHYYNTEDEITLLCRELVTMIN